MFYCTSKRPQHSLKCDFEVTEHGEFSNCFAATAEYVWNLHICRGGKIYVLKLASQNFPIIEKCKMKYASGHPLHIGTRTKDLWLSVKYVLCSLSCLLPLISGFPLGPVATRRKAVRIKHSNIQTMLLFRESWHSGSSVPK